MPQPHMPSVSARAHFPSLLLYRLDSEALTCKHVGSLSLSLALIAASMPGTTEAAIAIELGAAGCCLNTTIRCYEGCLANNKASAGLGEY